MLEPGAKCEIKGLLTTCGSLATAQCVYCGRPFCPKHGEVLEDGAEVCTRKNCVAKKEDLVVHLQYKEEVLTRNLGRVCGLHMCEVEIQVQCRRCKGYFCRDHTMPWTETVTDRPERICAHCVERRAIWERE
jgi:hypothetical protein